MKTENWQMLIGTYTYCFKRN